MIPFRGENKGIYFYLTYKHSFFTFMAVLIQGCENFGFHQDAIRHVQIQF